MDSVLLVAGLGALFLALVVGIAVAVPDRDRTAVKRTLATVDRGYRIAGAPTATAGGPGDGPLAGQARAVGRRLTPPAMFAGLGRRLDQAGNPSWLGLEALLGYKGLFLFVGAAAGLLLGLLGFPGGVLFLTLAGAAVGFFAPDLLALHLAQERQQEIRRTLPDIMDTLVVTVEAGLGFEAALAQVVRNGRGPMVGEFARVLHEMQIGRPRVEALREMAARTSVTELKAFASAMVQATTLGVPVANVLRQQAAEMRLRRRQRAEELAQKVPVKVLFPTVLCLLPALFVVVIGPGVLRLLDLFGN
ncbi:type II secretion system F family protein [Micromonospora sp. PLK6-60]|uniref:type II secretion system F family protein n=1 Tax=Micromonospora sp. PLK6-60 TaxID=2873383 RepID=UPI001CA62803|nr:type II secretion system F family protein [Micromonospora sp. PLK6-60]MBY8873686.1 type II secretion system F family protein [Micromonospora sp. PLK6-60]